MGDGSTAARETTHLDRIAASFSLVSPAAVPINVAPQAPSERGVTAAGVIADSSPLANNVGYAGALEEMDTDPPSPPDNAAVTCRYIGTDCFCKDFPRSRQTSAVDPGTP